MKLSYLAIALMFVVASAHAQLYKITNPDGSISYSDTPPTTAAKVEKKSYGGGGADLGNLPYELAQAAKANPVTLYTMKNCAACDSGRQLLNTRGIPFSEKTVSTNEDNDKLRSISGGNQLPLIMVGRNKQAGFEATQWGNMLTAANYPATSMLPKSYSNPAPQPAAPQATAKAADAPKKADDTPVKGIVQPPPAAGNAPPGFQF